MLIFCYSAVHVNDAEDQQTASKSPIASIFIISFVYLQLLHCCEDP